MERDEVDHYGATYRDFSARIYADVRARTFGEDIGQNGWLTAEEQDLFLSWLELDAGDYLLDVACGSGGPTLRMARIARCRACGIDLHEDAVRTAQKQAEAAGLSGQVTFQRADAARTLPFPDAQFDALLCVDAVNHLLDRAKTLRDWRRVLKPGGRLVFTNPVVVTGPVTHEEIAVRSSVGMFLFVPPGLDERLLGEAGFARIEAKDRTENMARIARAWRVAREAHADELRRIEGAGTFEGQQRFFEVAARLAEERRLSRMAYVARAAG